MTELAVVRSLEALGFNLNEGRAYAALLQLGASTGYEISRRAGIPRSAVYTTLRKLVTEGAARQDAGPPERFTATPPDALLAALSQRFDTSQAALREAVARLDVSPSVPDVFAVQGYERILEEAARVVRAAERILLVSGWPRELVRLAGELQAAVARGVYVATFSHAALPEVVPGVVFSYGLAEADLEAFWEHKLVVVADDRRSLLGATNDDPGDRAIVTETRAIAEIAVSQVSLDITLLAGRHGADAGPVLAKLLGDRIGRMDSLLGRPHTPVLGEERVAKAAAKRPRAR
jgi:sugar-specific transcriptional regulator TrmB